MIRVRSGNGGEYELESSRSQERLCMAPVPATDVGSQEDSRTALGTTLSGVPERSQRHQQNR